MPKNIVVCCDGTNNQFDGYHTNVIRTYKVARRNSEQITYYDPGVGTHWYDRLTGGALPSSAHVKSRPLRRGIPNMLKKPGDTYSVSPAVSADEPASARE